MTTTDSELLQQFTRDRLEAFATLVSRHVVLVYSAADQQVRTRATAFLNAAQLKVLADFQAQSLSMGKMGLRMQQTMLGDKAN